MNSEIKTTYDACDELLNQLDPELRVNVAARLFMEHCLTGEIDTGSSHLAPLINTVADALTRDLENEQRLELGVRSVAHR